MMHSTIAPPIPKSVGGLAQQRKGERWLRRFLVWAGRGLAAVAAFGLLLACAGFAYQTIATESDRRAHPAPGAMITVNGRSVHLQCAGQGSPTVILETGLGSWSSQWALIQPAVAQSTRVCSYDRAGLGWSETGLAPRDARRIATE